MLEPCIAQVLMVLDDGQRVLPSHVDLHYYEYASPDDGSPEKGTLHSWDSGKLATEHRVWLRIEHIFKGYVARSSIS